MKIFLIILLGYVIPLLIVSTLLLIRRRVMERIHTNWPQSNNLKELIINSREEGYWDLGCSAYGEYMLFAILPLFNIIALLILLGTFFVTIIGYIFSKIPIK